MSLILDLQVYTCLMVGILSILMPWCWFSRTLDPKKHTESNIS